jgi:hypothetical protein
MILDFRFCGKLLGSVLPGVNFPRRILDLDLDCLENSSIASGSITYFSNTDLPQINLCQPVENLWKKLDYFPQGQ